MEYTRNYYLPKFIVKNFKTDACITDSAEA